MFHPRSRISAWLTISLIVVACSFTGRLSAQESDAEALLGQMSAYIDKLNAFILTGDAYVDARLPAGHIIEQASEVTLRMDKPGRMRMTNLDSEGAKDLFFSDGILSLFSEKENFYAQAEVPKNVSAAADFAINEMGIDAPLMDFVSKDMASRMLADADEVRHLGTSLIRGALYEHIAIRNPEVDIQIWIASEGPPLPGKMSISSKWEGGAPRFVTFFSWDTNPSFPEGTLAFVPPAGAIRINFVRDGE